jgi:hypothetical protein
MSKAEVVLIYTAPEAEAPMVALESVQAVAGRGLQGDRYFKGEGTFSGTVEAPAYEVTLIESELIEAFNERGEAALEPHAFRRNLLTKGVSLNALVGKTFSVGDVTLKGARLCEPCNHLATVVRKDVLQMVHQAGLRAGIVSSGTIHVGDPIQVPVEERA